jgi:alcohol dehydrogenase
MGAGIESTERTRIVEGEGATARLGELTREELPDARTVLFVTDQGLVGAGHVEPAEASLRAAGFEVTRFADVRENPTTEDVDRCLAVAREVEPDLIVGFGGGSSIDVAKGTNFLYSCGGEMKDYWGVGKATAPLLPLVAVPTTAGTGTEVQSYALIADAKTHQKMACGDPAVAARLALLDPLLTLTMPHEVTAYTGLDAIGHAIETAVTTKRNEASLSCSRESWRLAADGFRRVLDRPDDRQARGEMLRAAALAGLAIEHSMLGAAHALANPLTARFKVPHGHAVALMLPHVVRFNAGEPGPAQTYAELARDAGLVEESASEEAAVVALAATLRALLLHTGFSSSIRAYGVGPEDCAALAAEAAQQWTGTFNPRSFEEADLEGLYLASIADDGKA